MTESVALSVNRETVVWKMDKDPMAEEGMIRIRCGDAIAYGIYSARVLCCLRIKWCAGTMNDKSRLCALFS